ncbi:MAG: HEAT repeat domain-containing protein [Phycisphaeraceae bacterium]
MAIMPSCAWRDATSGGPRAGAESRPAAPKALLEALDAEDPVVQADAARLLGDLRSFDAVGPLVRYVTESRHYAKTAGFDALARIGDADCCPDLRPLVERPNVPDDDFWYGRTSVQLFAALALLALGDTSGEEMLLDESSNLHNWAFLTWLAPSVLRLPDDSPTVARVKARITTETLVPPHKSDPGQLAYVTDALGLLGGASARQALVELCANPSRYVRGRASINLLVISSQREDVQRVERIASDDETLFARVKAAHALATQGDRAAVSTIASAVDEAESAFDRAAALDSLGVVGDAEHVSPAAAALRSGEAYVRQCAVEALDRLGTDAAVEAARTAREDPNVRVRLQVAKCLAAHA